MDDRGVGPTILKTTHPQFDRSLKKTAGTVEVGEVSFNSVPMLGRISSDACLPRMCLLSKQAMSWVCALVLQ